MLHSASTSITSQFRKNNSTSFESNRNSNVSSHDSNDGDSSEECSRMLLQGPSQCGKTSLLMDVAYDVIRRNRSKRRNSCRERNDDDNVVEVEVEPSVTFLTPSKNRSNLYFPLICSSSTTTSRDSNNIPKAVGNVGFHAKNDSMSELVMQEQQFQKQMSALEHQQRKLNHHDGGTHSSSSSANHSTFGNSNWNIQDHASILSKIQIRYIDSIYDLMKYLASIHCNSLKRSNQQVSCMIIDDSDYFIKDCDMSSNGNTMESQMNSNEDKDVAKNDNHSVAKSLFHDLDQVQNENEKEMKRPKERSCNHGASSTVEMMRLVQLCKFSNLATLMMKIRISKSLSVVKTLIFPSFVSFHHNIKTKWHISQMYVIIYNKITSYHHFICASIQIICPSPNHSYLCYKIMYLRLLRLLLLFQTCNMVKRINKNSVYLIIMIIINLSRDYSILNLHHRHYHHLRLQIEYHQFGKFV